MEGEMKILKGATGFIRLRDFWLSAKIRISAAGADIIPKWEYVRTPSEDMNKLSAHCG
jgi:hypothetical protein